MMQRRNSLMKNGWLYDTMISIYVFALLIGSRTCVSQGTLSVGVCRCKTSDGAVIDLTSLDSRNSTSPAFSNVTTPDNSLSYSYNPCTGFSCAESNDGAVCVKTNNTSTAAGLQTNSRCVEENPRQLAIVYESKDANISSKVLLVCSNSDIHELVAMNFNGLLHSLELRSSFCCLSHGQSQIDTTTTKTTTTTATTTAPPSNSSLSVGSVLLIIFFSLLLAYLVFGILFRMLVVGARGYEVLPHFEFWSSLPGLIQDGFAFTLQLIFGSPATSSRAGYSEIDSEAPRGTPYQQIPQNPQV